MRAHDQDLGAIEIPSTQAVGYSLKDLWQVLDAEGWSRRAWRQHLGEVVAWGGTLVAAERIPWLAALWEMWLAQSWALDEGALGDLFDLARQWCAWPLAAAAGEALARRRPLRSEEIFGLGDAHCRSGDPMRAEQLLVAGQLAYPEAVALHDIHCSLRQWADHRRHFGWVDGHDWGDDALILEPLGHHHLADFAWQYHDPTIAERCCLPAFESDTQWHRWLDAVYNCGDQKIYAVIHREWGFIGSVSLILHDGIGFFYYWFGPDFQGQGFGPRAVTLMLASAAEHYGLHTCYAKVYEDNIPSRRALEKLGFEDIKVCAVAPDNDEVFYRRGPLADRGRIAEELHWLLAAMNSGTRPAILLQDKH